MEAWNWQAKCWDAGPRAAGRRAVLAATAAATVRTVLAPAQALAQGVAVIDPSGFGNVLAAALNIADWLCVGVIMFAGGSWMFGDRTKAMQHFIGGAVGYLIIRKAPLIQAFLKTL